MNYKILRKKHPRFVYESFRWSFKGKDFCMDFRFKLEPDVVFNPRVVVKNVPTAAKKIRKEVLDNLVFHLGLAEIPSYWKCTLSPNIVVNAGPLNARQISFWKNLILNGLGEFFYQNKINPYARSFFTITAAQKKAAPIFKKRLPKDRFLVPIGGGKDSLVTMEIVKSYGKEFRPLILGNVPSAFAASAAATNAAPIMISRSIDPELLRLNGKGYLNGHTPFSAYLAFLSTLSSALFDFSRIAISQERSANEENIKWKGRNINHQYSKSFAFEKKFREYAKCYLSPTINYFSALRPIYELQIGQIFSKFPRYFNAFKSCNVFLKKNAWCGRCPKCLSTYFLLSPFIDEGKLTRIFGRALLNDASLWHYIPAFLGLSGPRPFDCIGTKKEMRAAICLTLKKYHEEKRALPKLLKRFSAEFKTLCKKDGAAQILGSWDNRNFLPAGIDASLKKLLKK